MPRLVPVGRPEQFAAGTLTPVEVGGSKLLLVCLADRRLVCVKNACPHQALPLDQGILRGEELECNWHNTCMNVCTGKITDDTGLFGLEPLPTYQLVLHEGHVCVELPD